MENSRIDGRQNNELRKIKFITDFIPKSSGSVLSCYGDTQVICSAMLIDSVPAWMKYQNVEGGWLTAEYSMLPYSTSPRKPRDINRGKIDSRSVEIQRLIGRSLRAVVDLKKIGRKTLWVDCDVLNADGGTRTASISGACLAIALAFKKEIDLGTMIVNPLKALLAGVSVGVFNDEVILDLNYHEDNKADADFNLVMNEKMQYVEIQGTGEEATFSEEQMQEMLKFGKKGIEEIINAQKEIIENY